MNWRRGRLVHPEGPPRPDPARWLEPLLFGSNAALFAAHLAVTPTARLVFREPFVLEAELDRPRIYITWHRFNYVATPVLLSLPSDQRPTLIAHDGVASRFSHRSTAWMGFEVLVFRRRSSTPPRQQIIDYVRATRRSIVNLPDSGGPYGVMKPGILEVARACDARIIPFQTTADRAVSVGRELEHVIPLPRCRIEVRRGAALDGTVTVDDCQRALDALA